jgi:hypothetical protein
MHSPIWRRAARDGTFTAAEVERVPSSATSQKQFTVGFVLLVKPGENPATAVAVETLRSAWAGSLPN